MPLLEFVDRQFVDVVPTGRHRHPRRETESESHRRAATAVGVVVTLALTVGNVVLGPIVFRDTAVPVSDTTTLAVQPDAGAGSAPSEQVFDAATSPGSVTDASAASPAPVEQRPARFTNALPDQRAQVAIRTAMAQLGLPYVWGGDGPSNGHAGFDCSGLTTFSYAAAGVTLPRTAHTQYYAGPHVAADAALQPGDLVFYGTPARVHHVGLFLGEGKMVNAPTFGKPVQVAFHRWGGDDYLGATRPAATDTTTGAIPYSPPAATTPTPPQEFPAPVAPAPTVPPAPAVPPAPLSPPTEVPVTLSTGPVPTTTAPLPPGAGVTTPPAPPPNSPSPSPSPAPSSPATSPPRPSTIPQSAVPQSTTTSAPTTSTTPSPTP